VRAGEHRIGRVRDLRAGIAVAFSGVTLAGLARIRPRTSFAAVAPALPKTIAYVALGGALADPLSARGALAAALYVTAAAGGAMVGRRLVRARPGAAAAAA
jgi:hypothetical protein